MWMNCCQTARLKIAASGSTSVTDAVGGDRVNPDGAFIQALTARTQNVPKTPATIIGTSVSRCASVRQAGPTRRGRCP